MNTYISNLAIMLENFIKYKNALGIKYESSIYYLKQLDIYNYNHGNANVLTKEVAG